MTTTDLPRNRHDALYLGERVEILTADRSGANVLARGATVPRGLGWIPRADTVPLVLQPVAVAAE